MNTFSGGEGGWAMVVAKVFGANVGIEAATWRATPWHDT
jgi:hypothetical protein